MTTITSNTVTVTVSSSSGSGYELTITSATSMCGTITIQGQATLNGQPLANANIEAEYNAYYSPTSNIGATGANTDQNGNFTITLPTNTPVGGSNSVWVWIDANGQQNAPTNEIIQVQQCSSSSGEYTVDFDIKGAMPYISITLSFNGNVYHATTNDIGDAQISVLNVSAGTYTWDISGGSSIYKCSFSPSTGTLNVSGSNSVITQYITASCVRVIS